MGAWRARQPACQALFRAIGASACSLEDPPIRSDTSVYRRFRSPKPRPPRLIARKRLRDDPPQREDRDLTTVPHIDDRPILFLDVDGVISLFGFPANGPPPGAFHSIDGIIHCIGERAAELLARLADRFELVWATGWEEKANEYLPHLLGLGRELPVLSFDGHAVFGSAHWKLGAIDRYAGDRPAAWIDDFVDDECRAWAARRDAPTLIVEAESAIGMTEEHVERLLAWAEEVTVSD